MNFSSPNASEVPRYTDIPSFYRLPMYKEDMIENRLNKRVGIVGIPFDSGCTYRPGARFGPQNVRNASMIVRPYSIYHNINIFDKHDCTDMGNLKTNPFNISKSVDMIAEQLSDYYKVMDNLFIIGGDHTITYPVLKAVNEKYGKVSVIHFDSHFDTWDQYFGEKVTHGTPFKRVFEEGLIDVDHSIHVGIRGTLNGYEDIENDKKIGFDTIFCHETDTLGIYGIVDKIKRRVGDNKVYISLDIDVVDPAFAPGTGTPECGGYTSSQIISIVRGLKGLNVIGGDVVEVSPPYDSGDITSLLASTLCYEFVCLL